MTVYQITNQARKGVGFVAWVQNHHQSNVWDKIHSLAGWTCGVEVRHRLNEGWLLIEDY